MKREINKIQKQIRAEVIKDYLFSIGQNKCVCFTCGNASEYLKQTGLEVIEVINPVRWWEYSEIQKEYKCFDATSGHLPIPLMYAIAKKLYQKLGKIDDGDIACGSGETFVTLKIAFPLSKLNPVYNIDKSTLFNEQAPLNTLVLQLKKTTMTEFEHIGYFKEFYKDGKYIGTLSCETDGRDIGYNGRKKETSPNDIILQNKKKIKANTEVTTAIYPLCGKMIK